MARLVFNEVLTLGLSVDNIATDWQISLDVDFNDLLVDIVADYDNVFSITVPIRNHDGTIYTGDGPVYARARILIDDEYGPWINLPICYPEDLNSLSDDEREKTLSEALKQNIY